MIGGVAPIRDRLACADRCARSNGSAAVASLDAARPLRRRRLRRRAWWSTTSRHGRAAAASAASTTRSATPRARSRTDFDARARRARRGRAWRVPFHDGARSPAAARRRRARAVERRASRAATRAWRASSTASSITVPPAAADAGAARCKRARSRYILINRDGAGDPARLAHLRALLDPRRRADLRRAAAAGARRGGARASSRWYAPLPVPRRQGPLLRRPPRRRPGARARQPRRSSSTWSREYYRFTRRRRASSTSMWPRGRDAPSTTSTRCARSAHDRRVPTGRTSAASSASLPESISHEGYSRASRCTPTGTTSSRCAASRTPPTSRRVLGDDAHAARFAALRDAFRADLCASIDRTMAHARHRLHPRLASSSATSTPTSTAIALAPGGELASLPHGRARAHLRALLRRTSLRAPRRPARVGALHAVRAAQRRRRSCGSAGASAPSSCSTSSCATSGPPAGTSGPRSSGATRARRASSATCRTPGSARTSCARALDLFAYERESDRALVLAAGVPLAWLDGKRGRAGRAASRTPLRARSATRWRNGAAVPSSASNAASPSRRAGSCDRAPPRSTGARRIVTFRACGVR